MELKELFAVQIDSNKLKSLYIELANHESFNPYKGNIITDMPRGGGGKSFNEWYTEEKERIEREIKLYQELIQEDRKKVDGILKDAPYPVCDIIRYRAVNNMGWFEIGDILGMDRRTASRKFYEYVRGI